MEEKAKSTDGNLKKKHFARLHEKIQNKYNEMQKKLDKSKSVDSLMNLDEDFIFVQQSFSSNKDMTEGDDVSSDAESVKRHSVIVEDVRRRATFQEIYCSEANESDSMFTTSELNNDSVSEPQFFGDNFRTSFESLNEIAKGSNEFLASPSPTPKYSMRDKIGSRISAVKEKRREDKGKNTKDKKKESLQKVEKFVLSNTTKQDATKKKNRIATVTIALIEATGFENESSIDEKPRMIHCRFRLGAEKRKSKSIKNNAGLVGWQELFNINLFDDDMLEISLWENNTFLGRNILDLSEVEKEKTHRMRINVEECVPNVQIFILLTINGISLLNTFVDIDDYQETLEKLESARKKFKWYKLQNDSTDVGWLSIIVYGAKGLAANECYCVFKLGNERLQTQTESKTQDPNWMKMFTFAVTDVTSILEIIVYDEKKSEEVGKLSIPLLRINNRSTNWYALKESTQRDRAKGNNPRILLEMRFTWNLVKAAVRVINPKEVNYLESEIKFDRHLFSRNLARARAVLNWVFDAFKVIKTCFEWESRKWNTIALTTWLLFCWFFKVWMLPLLLLIPFVWYRPQKYFLVNWKKYFRKEIVEYIEAKEEKNSTSLRQRINSLQEMVHTVQNGIGAFASLGESIKNMFNFTVPFLSFLTIFIIMIITTVMFLIPVNYIFMFWGIHKFTRKILWPNRVPNNEILDLLSRVPDDEILLNCEELPLQELSEEDAFQIKSSKKNNTKVIKS